MTSSRLSTGISPLDVLLGGGLLPGTLTVVAGATGVGKTQLGLHFANAGLSQEGERGVVLDLTARGDAQNQVQYAERLFGWRLSEQPADVALEPSRVWDRAQARRDYLHVFDRSGRRVTRHDLDHSDWQAWKIELIRKLQTTLAFCYGNFVQGVRCTWPNTAARPATAPSYLSTSPTRALCLPDSRPQTGLGVRARDRVFFASSRFRPL